MRDLNVIDEITLKQDMKEMYKNIGYTASLQCLYELIKSAEIMATVIAEQHVKD